MLFDKWQEEVLECKSKRILICKGRQIGGTTVLAKKASDSWVAFSHNFSLCKK